MIWRSASRGPCKGSTVDWRGRYLEVLVGRVGLVLRQANKPRKELATWRALAAGSANAHVRHRSTFLDIGARAAPVLLDALVDHRDPSLDHIPPLTRDGEQALDRGEHADKLLPAWFQPILDQVLVVSAHKGAWPRSARRKVSPGNDGMREPARMMRVCAAVMERQRRRVCVRPLHS